MTASVPVWVLLVVAAIGAAATLGAQYIAARISAERTDRREKAIYERELDRMREQWGREDRLRTFEQRRDAYLAHAAALAVMEREARKTEYMASAPAARLGLKSGSTAPLEKAIEEVRRTGTLTMIYAPAGHALEASKKATATHLAYGLDVLLSNGGPSERVDVVKNATESRAEFLNAVRADLGVAGTTDDPLV